MKKVMAIVLMLTMLCLPVSVQAAEESAENNPAFLRAVGILDKTFVPSGANVTRGEAAMILAHCLGAGTLMGETVFSDVTASTLYAGEIAAAYKAGLISGFGDGTFRPGEVVTYNQMVKMLVSMLGYDHQAKAAGGYPSGYLTVAVQKDITKDLAPGGDAPLSVPTMEKLVRRALDTPIAEAKTYEDGFVNFEETDKTVLSAWHGIDKITGTVTADFLASFETGITVGKDEVCISGNVYKQGETAAASFLCQRVEAYIERETETILFIEPRAGNEVLRIPAGDILEVTASLIRYETERGEETVSLSDAALVKNGQRLSPWVPQDLYFENGLVTIVSTGGNASYILAEQYINRIVESVDAENGEVRFKDGGSLAIDTEGSRKTLFVEADGKPADLRYTYPWDIFSVMESKNALKVIRSEKFVLGTIEEISEKCLIIDGVYYDYAPGFREDKTLTQPELGLEAGFTFDYTGRLAAINQGNSFTGNYGILVSGHQTAGLSPESQLKIFTANAEMCGFEVAENIRINGKGAKEADLFAKDSPILSAGKVARQMVSYAVNEAGEISELDTADDFTMRPDDEGRLASFSKDLYINESRKAGDGEEITYRDQNAEQFGGKYRVRSGTLVFVLPEEGGADADYGMVTPQSLLGGSQADKLKRVTFYDLDEFYNISAMTWVKSEGGQSVPTQGDEKLFVAKTFAGLDEDGMAVNIIEGWHEEGDYRRYTVEEGLESYFKIAFTDVSKEDPALLENGVQKNKVPASVVKPGDLIQLRATNSGHITWMNIVARGASLPDYEINYDGYGGAPKNPNAHGLVMPYMLACGTVKRATSDAVVVETKSHLDPTKTFIRVYPDTGVNLLFDSEKGTTEKISMSKIKEDDTVLNIAETQSQRFCIVFR